MTRALANELGPWVITALTLGLVIVGVVIAWRRYAISQVPVAPPLGTSLTRAARVDHQDLPNDVLLVEPGRRSPARSSTQTGLAVDGTVTGIGLSTVLPAGAAPADRLRPVVRRVDAARARRAHCRRPGHPDPRSTTPTVILLPLADRPHRRAPAGRDRVVGAPGRPRPGRRAARRDAARAVLGVAALTASILAPPAQSGLSEVHAWIPAFDASYAVGVDGVGLALVLAVGAARAAGRAGRLARAGQPHGGHGPPAPVPGARPAARGVHRRGVRRRDVFLFYVFFEAMLSRSTS